MNKKIICIDDSNSHVLKNGAWYEVVFEYDDVYTIMESKKDFHKISSPQIFVGRKNRFITEEEHKNIQKLKLVKNRLEQNDRTGNK